MQTTPIGDVIVARIPQRLDTWTCPEAERQFNLVLEAGARKILCDLSQTEYISSAGLRLLLTAAARVERHGARLALCGAAPVVRELFNVAGVSSRFDIYQTPAAALSHFAAAPSSPVIE